MRHPGCHPFVREIEDIVLKQDLISLIYRMYYIIVDKCLLYTFALSIFVFASSPTHTITA